MPASEERSTSCLEVGHGAIMLPLLKEGKLSATVVFLRVTTPPEVT